MPGEGDSGRLAKWRETARGTAKAFQEEPALVAIALVYLVQGLTDLAWLAEKYFLKDELGASPAQVALFLSLASVPWMVKPLIGFVSDSIPLLGYRRRSYLLLASAAAAGSWLYMAVSATDLSSTLWAIMVGSAAVAVSDVVVDSLVVEKARDEDQGEAGSLQSLCWAAYAVGQIATAALSGSLVEQHGPRFVFALTAFFPLLIGLASLVVHEDRVEGWSAAGSASSSSGRASSGGDAAAGTTALEAQGGAEARLLPGASSTSAAPATTTSVTSVPPATSSSGHAGVGPEGGSAASGSDGSDRGAMARTRQRLQRLLHGAAADPLPPEAAATTATTASAATNGTSGAAAPPAGPSGPLAAAGSRVSSLRSAASSAREAVAANSSALWSALSAPAIAWPVTFLILLSATPAADDAVFFFEVEALGFSPSFLGNVQLAIAVASLVGVWLYHSLFKAVPLRSFLLWGNLLGAGLMCSDLLLVSRTNAALGLDDHLFVLGGSVVTSVIANVLSMPTLVLAARLCPKGLEATMFATIMSLLNMADGVRYAGGAALMQWLGVGSGHYENLPLLVGLCNAALLLPLPVLALVPRDLECEALLGAGAGQQQQQQQQQAGQQAAGSGAGAALPLPPGGELGDEPWWGGAAAVPVPVVMAAEVVGPGGARGPGAAADPLQRAASAAPPGCALPSPSVASATSSPSSPSSPFSPSSALSSASSLLGSLDRGATPPVGGPPAYASSAPSAAPHPSEPGTPTAPARRPAPAPSRASPAAFDRPLAHAGDDDLLDEGAGGAAEPAAAVGAAPAAPDGSRHPVAAGLRALGALPALPSDLRRGAVRGPRRVLPGSDLEVLREWQQREMREEGWE